MQSFQVVAAFVEFFSKPALVWQRGPVLAGSCDFSDGVGILWVSNLPDTVWQIGVDGRIRKIKFSHLLEILS